MKGNFQNFHTSKQYLIGCLSLYPPFFMIKSVETHCLLVKSLVSPIFHGESHFASIFFIDKSLLSLIFHHVFHFFMENPGN